MKLIFIAIVLFVAAVLSGVTVSYLAIQPLYEDLEQQSSFMLEQFPRDRHRVAQIYVANLAFLLSDAKDDALRFNCLFLQSEIQGLSPSQFQHEREKERVAELIDRASSLVNQVEEMNLCDWKTNDSAQL